MGSHEMNTQEISLDPWFHHYAHRAQGLSASEVRALFAVASRPEVVSLAGGMPYVSALPKELISTALETVMAEQGPAAMQYGSGQGIPALREQIVEIMGLEGISASLDDVVVTTGSQQALDLVTKLFIDPGDVIIAEAPSYVGAMGVFRSYQADVVHVEMDEHGLVPEVLEETIKELQLAGRTIKFLYTIPNFHNPAGVTLSAERRPVVLEICQRYGVLIVEDNPYGLLSFDAEVPPALRSLNADGIIYLGSFSKTLAPGFRVGWVLAPHAIREKLVLAAEAAILCPSSFSQMVISEYLRTSDWKAQINAFRDVYRERRDAMNAALQELLPEFKWNVPAGGFYMWCSLPEGLDSKAMLPRAVTELVAYTPGTAFFADGRGRQQLRLSFCYPTPEQITLGIRRLATVVRGELDLLADFAGTGTLSVVESERSASAPPTDVR
jgi:DNA-binding transcriptional MocR family regulator